MFVTQHSVIVKHLKIKINSAILNFSHVAIPKLTPAHKTSSKSDSSYQLPVESHFSPLIMTGVEELLFISIAVTNQLKNTQCL